MDILSVAFGLVGTVLQLVEQAKTASKEQHDAIVTRLSKTTVELQDAIAEAHAVRESESQKTKDAIEKARNS